MLKELTKQERLFNYYLGLQSEEFKEEIKGFKIISMKSTLCAIKVIFKNGNWIRVYQKNTGKVEWY